MPTTSGKAAGHPKTSARVATRGLAGTRLLEQDHREVEGLFKAFKAAKDDSRKQSIADEICKALTVHTQIEEEILYQAAREAMTDKQEDLVDEAVVEHASAKDLIAEIEAMQAGDDLFDAKVTVLGEMIDHHVGEEEREMFPLLRKKRNFDDEAVGERLKARKARLMAKPGGPRPLQ